MRGWLARFHGDNPGVYTVLAARRAEIEVGGRMRRLVLEAAKVERQGRALRPEWLVIYWCIDGPGVVFHRCPTHQAALARLKIRPTEGEVVFSRDPRTE